MSHVKVREDAPFDMRIFNRSRDNPPQFCPLCGRPLERGGWDTVEGDERYEYLCCFGGSWWAWWARLVKVTEPRSAHYLYNLGSRKKAVAYDRFDRQTGKPL